MSLRILLVDDHEPFRRVLVGLLAKQPGLSVIGQAASGEAALDLLAALPAAALPHVMVVDLEMPGLGGIETTRRVRAAYPTVGIVALSVHDDAPLVAAMKAAGAKAYVRKSDPLAQVVQAIRDAAAGP